MIQFFLFFSAIVVVLRLIVFGYIVSKHGEPMPHDTYNAYTHPLTTILWGLLFYTLYKL